MDTDKAAGRNPKRPPSSCFFMSGPPPRLLRAILFRAFGQGVGPWRGWALDAWACKRETRSKTPAPNERPTESVSSVRRKHLTTAMCTAWATMKAIASPPFHSRHQHRPQTGLVGHCLVFPVLLMAGLIDSLAVSFPRPPRSITGPCIIHLITPPPLLPPSPYHKAPSAPGNPASPQSDSLSTCPRARPNLTPEQCTMVAPPLPQTKRPGYTAHLYGPKVNRAPHTACIMPPPIAPHLPLDS